MAAPNVSSRVERLVRATPELIGELHLDKVLDRIAAFARDLLEARQSAVGLRSTTSRTPYSLTTSGFDRPLDQLVDDLPAGRGVFGRVIREGQVSRLSGLADGEAVGLPVLDPAPRSFLGVPIVGRDGITGALYLLDKVGSDEFSDEDVHLALLLAAIVASAVANAEYHERTTRLLEEVQQLHRNRERFFAMVNHELRNSLAAVYGWAELMVRKRDPATVPRPALEIIGAAEQAIALVNDLLDLNRLDEDRLRPVLERVDCEHLLQAAIQRASPAAADKQVTFTVRRPDGADSTCRTDAHRVEQILTTLLANAIRVSPTGATVLIRIAGHADTVEIHVADQGPGITGDMVDRIFDIYYSVAQAESVGGLAIGLALSRRLARVLGGDIRALPQAAGGTHFILSLPRSVHEDDFTNR